MSAGLAAAVAVTVSLFGAPVSSASAATRTTGPPITPLAHPFGGIPTVGPLFVPDTSVHTCTASVVASPKGDLLITAAHCISGTAKGYTFAPGYHNGIEPYGAWKVVAAYGAAKWISHQSTQYDFALLVVAPRRVDGRSKEIQEVTGANQLRAAPAPGERVSVPAYNLGSGDDPITCSIPVYYRGKYPAFNCDPYYDGTSGAPWLHQVGHRWVVVGVIGGLHQGGCYPWTSYSPAFGIAIARTYARAAKGAKASTFPSAGSDGCSTGS